MERLVKCATVAGAVGNDSHVRENMEWMVNVQLSQERLVMAHKAQMWGGWTVRDDVQPVLDTLSRGNSAFYQSNSPNFKSCVFRITPDKLTAINEFLGNGEIYSILSFWVQFGEAYEYRFDSVVRAWWKFGR